MYTDWKTVGIRIYNIFLSLKAFFLTNEKLKIVFILVNSAEPDEMLP